MAKCHLARVCTIVLLTVKNRQQTKYLREQLQVYICTSNSRIKMNEIWQVIVYDWSWSTPTVKSHVLGKRLCKSNAVTITQELTDSNCITINVTASKALVSHVEERKQLPLLHSWAQLLPLLRLHRQTGMLNREHRDITAEESKLIT